MARTRKINLIDTPGEPRFVADALGALRVCESRRLRGQRRAWASRSPPSGCGSAPQELGVARLVFVNMLDRERADFFRTLDSLKDAFGPHVVATEIPIGSEHEIRGMIDLVDMKAYEYDGDRQGQLHGDPDPRRDRRRSRRSTARS